MTFSILIQKLEKLLTFFLSIAMWTIFVITYKLIDYFGRSKIYNDKKSE